jgi:hypothetical protein
LAARLFEVELFALPRDVADLLKPGAQRLEIRSRFGHS